MNLGSACQNVASAMSISNLPKIPLKKHNESNMTHGNSNSFNWAEQRYDGFYSPLNDGKLEQNADSARRRSIPPAAVKRVEKDSFSFQKKKMKLEPRIFETNIKLPKELQELIFWNKCGLCDAELSSNLSAQQHYEGKPHGKKLKHWFEAHPEYAEEYQESIDAITKKKEKIMDQERLYCKYCDITLSSETAAVSHYTGKKHQEVIKKGVPKNSFFNTQTQQWERVETAKEDKTGRFGIGLSFINVNNTTSVDPPTTLVSSSSATTTQQGHKFFCNVCNVACCSQSSLDSHCNGAKHKKKWAAVQNSQSNQTEPSSAAKDNILESVISFSNDPLGLTDLSIYRTPSGNYYCKECNVTVNSQLQFQQHSASKKHKNKISKK